jgi:hypothetical protein
MGLIERTPDAVFKRTGKKAPKKIMNAADRIPIPSHTIAIGIHAKGGMGRTSSMIGLNRR